MKTAICLCTYKRPKPLEHMLKSLETLMCEKDDVMVFVVDNDPLKHEGQNLVKSLAKGFKYKIVCEVEEGVGISRARNRSLQMVQQSGVSFDYVAFTDDDTEVSPQWLRDLIRTSQVYGADIVSGKVEPLFSQKPEDKNLMEGFFRQQFVSEATGTPVESAATNNLLVKAPLILQECPKVFDEYLGTFGGEDQDFIIRMSKKGCKIVKCASAIVYEIYPPQRLTVEWTMKRNFRCGSSYAYNFRKNYGKNAFFKLAVRKSILLPWRYLRTKAWPTLQNKGVLMDNLGFFYFLLKGKPYEEYKR